MLLLWQSQACSFEVSRLMSSIVDSIQAVMAARAGEDAHAEAVMAEYVWQHDLKHEAGLQRPDYWSTTIAFTATTAQRSLDRRAF